MNKDEKLQLTKEKLMDSAFQLMDSMEDPMNVTSREIAAAAGVKAGMINYCFGSRENLLYHTFQKQYLSFLKEKGVREIIESGKTPKEILKKLHYVVAQCLIEHHKFTKAITGFVLFKRDLSKESFSYSYVYRHYAGKKTEAECKLIAYELSTMMQLIIFRREDVKRDFGIDLEDREELKHYVDLRIDMLLTDN